MFCFQQLHRPQTKIHIQTSKMLAM